MQKLLPSSIVDISLCLLIFPFVFLCFLILMGRSGDTETNFFFSYICTKILEQTSSHKISSVRFQTTFIILNLSSTISYFRNVFQFISKHGAVSPENCSLPGAWNICLNEIISPPKKRLMLQMSWIALM